MSTTPNPTTFPTIKVGIGTTSPTKTLDVNGEARIRVLPAGSVSDNIVVAIPVSGALRQIPVSAFPGLANAWVLGGNSPTSINNILGTLNALPLKLITSSTERMRILANGNVGIGTITPTATLHINGTTRFSGIATLDSGVQLRAAAAGGARILGEPGNTPLRPAIGFFSTDGVNDGGGGNGIFRPLANEMAFATASTTRMTITSGGAVGIGTPSPTKTLDVNGEARIRVLPLGLVSDNIVVAIPGSGALRQIPVSALSGAGTPAPPNGSVQFNNSGVFGGDANFIWDNTNKRLGIGTNNFPPENALEVRGNVSLVAGPFGRVYLANAPIQATFFNDDSPKLSFFTAYAGITGPSIQKIFDGTSHGRGRLAFFQHGATDYTTETEVMSIASYGYVGIGTPTPQNTLDVNGGVRVGSLATGTTVNVCANASGDLILCASDARLKTKITQLANVLDKLDSLRGVSFEWNESAEAIGVSSGHREIGVIAQEVEAVFPEVVATSNSTGYKAVDYSRLTAVLIEAVKELKAENDALQQRLEALEKAVAER